MWRRISAGRVRKVGGGIFALTRVNRVMVSRLSRYHRLLVIFMSDPQRVQLED